MILHDFVCLHKVSTDSTQDDLLQSREAPTNSVITLPDTPHWHRRGPASKKYKSKEYKSCLWCLWRHDWLRKQNRHCQVFGWMVKLCHTCVTTQIYMCTKCGEDILAARGIYSLPHLRHLIWDCEPMLIISLHLSNSFWHRRRCKWTWVNVWLPHSLAAQVHLAWQKDP